MRNEESYTNRTYEENYDDRKSVEVTTPTKRESTDSKTVKKGKVANAPKVRIRNRPSLTADVLQIVDEGTPIEILNRSGDFYRVRFNKNELGYIYNPYCEVI